MEAIKLNVFDVETLNERIRQTKAQQDLEWIAIKDEITELKVNLRPLNLIRNTVEEINETVGFKGNLAQSAVSIGIGYLTKKFVVGKSDSTVKNIFGSLLQLVVTNLVSKKQEPHYESSNQEESYRD
ncbi:hypothetical protein [Flavobacterium hercynium]|uniref:Uncharacterized protein n=1 Tax=Flavobacterium hercynium TaxID=387094 RepID=A0A226GTW4_9FLAO|nr:hypothetical protein [Flavobacterium hercynium]OXA85482.1 hypothetical protein B0A66_19600 [Flavobacterium hercynium]SMP16409.1 hypothetical protein SAMN06265346_10539 [Flavobacterium hercynium]